MIPMHPVEYTVGLPLQYILSDAEWVGTHPTSAALKDPSKPGKWSIVTLNYLNT
jgi:hypothetical protein